ncbi:MAG: FtsK/SpoIIIE domain-containing protein [Planctomycetota bacterium]
MTAPAPESNSTHDTSAQSAPSAALSSIGQRQLAALADLIDLSNTSDRTERLLNADAQQRQEFINRRYEQTTDRIATRLGTRRHRLQKKQAKQRAALEADYKQNQSKLEADAAKLRKKIEVQSQEARAKTDSEATHEKWVADSMLEGRLNELKKEFEQDRDQVETMRSHAQRLDGQTIDSLKRYRHRDLDLPHLSLSARDDEVSTDPETSYNQLIEGYASRDADLKGSLRRLKKLLLPALFMSFLPYLIWFALTGGLVAGAVFLGQTLGWTWSPIITGGGAFVVGGALIWFLGRLAFGVATKQVAAAFADYRGNRESLLQHLGRIETVAQAKHDRQAEAARAERDAAHEKTQAKFAPYFEKTDTRRAESVTELENKVKTKAEALETNHRQALDAFDTEADTTLQRLTDRIERRTDIATRRRDRDQQKHEAEHGSSSASLQQRWEAGRDRLLKSLDEMQRLEETSNKPWADAAWAQWTPPTSPAPAVRFGSITLDTENLLDEEAAGGRFDLDLPASLSVPALLSGPDRRSLYLGTTPEQRPAALAMMQSVMLRLLTTMPPGQVKFTLIDPVGLGESFGGFMHLADHEESLVNGRVWSEPAHIDRRLTDLTDHMGQMIQKYLRNDYASIDEYNQQAGELAEPYRFLVVSDYPNGFSTDAAARLNSLAASGARCGVFVLVLHDVRTAPPSGEIDDLKRHCVVSSFDHDTGWRWRHPVTERFPFSPDTPPGEDLVSQIVGKVGRAAIEAGRVQVPFSTITPAEDSDDFWSRKASEDLEVSIGRAGATRLQSFRVGRGVAQHALVAGKTGSGKSSLLHTLITNLCLWYPPDQLELYLIDFKKGVEFKPYVNHRPPHLRAIAIESDREFGLSILKRLDAMLDERGEKFRESGVANLAGYHRAEPDKPMPRVMLIVDEFQELFGQDDAISQSATQLLDRLVRQGRAFGMHAFLGSQSLSGAAGLPRGTMGQMAVRIALQCSENDSQLILGDENSAARLLTRPGEAIYNDQNGTLEANSLFQVAWLPDHELRDNLRTIVERSAERGVDPAASNCYVFEGNAPALLSANEPLNALLNAPDWPAASDNRAPAAYVGEPIAIDAPTAVAFPKLNGANALILGQNADSTLGLLCSGLLSLAASHHPVTTSEGARFVVFNGSTEPEHDDQIRQTLDTLPHGVAQVPFRDVDTSLAELHAELKRRIEEGATDAPTTFIAVFGLQRFRQFRKSDDGFSFSLDDDAGGSAKPDEQLLEILRDGPVVGMHLIVFADRAASIEPVFDRRALREFDNRVMFQMSATDSAQIIDSSEANDLGPYRALLYREDRGTITRFRPYGMPSDDDLARFKKAFSRPYRGNPSVGESV